MIPTTRTAESLDLATPLPFRGNAAYFSPLRTLLLFVLDYRILELLSLLLLPDSRNNAKPTEIPAAQRDAWDEDHVFSPAHLDDTTLVLISLGHITHGADRRLLLK